MHVLFDLDGTLTDPKPGITRSIAYALSCLGREIDPDGLGWCIGPPLRGSLASLIETEDANLIEVALSHYRHRFAKIGLFENRVYEGIPEAIEQLLDNGYVLHVATSKPEVYARRIVDHFELGRYFTTVVGSELCGARETKTEIIAHVLSVASMDPSLAVMVGDREHDVIGASAHGMPCLGVLYGYGTPGELEMAAATCTHPSELPTTIFSLLSAPIEEKEHAPHSSSNQ